VVTLPLEIFKLTIIYCMRFVDVTETTSFWEVRLVVLLFRYPVSPKHW
jgi:hypothetical protein